MSSDTFAFLRDNLCQNSCIRWGIRETIVPISQKWTFLPPLYFNKIVVIFRFISSHEINSTIEKTILFFLCIFHLSYTVRYDLVFSILISDLFRSNYIPAFLFFVSLHRKSHRLKEITPNLDLFLTRGCRQPIDRFHVTSPLSKIQN